MTMQPEPFKPPGWLTEHVPDPRMRQRVLDAPVPFRDLIMYLEELKAANKRLAARLDTLERDMADVKERGLAYKGVFQNAADYKAGDVTTFDGSMFVALRTVDPGEASPEESSAWQLCCKRGRDGKGTRP